MRRVGAGFGAVAAASGGREFRLAQGEAGRFGIPGKLQGCQPRAEAVHPGGNRGKFIILASVPPARGQMQQRFQARDRQAHD